MNELQPIPFHGDTIFIVDHEGHPYVPVRPLVENLGLDWPSQYVKLTAQKDRWSVVMITTVAGDGKQREMVCIPIRKSAAFLYSIDAGRVRHDLRDKVLVYQNECDEVLWNYWTTGVAVNDRTLSGVVLVDKDKYVEILEEQNRLLRLEQGILVQRAKIRKRFTADEDAMMVALHKQGLSQGEIGRRIGRPKESIHTRLRRMKIKGGNV